MKATVLILMLGLVRGDGVASGRVAATGAHGQMEARAAAPSTTLAVTMNEKTARLSMADLQALPQTSLTVKNGHSGAMETYTGASVGDVLAKSGFSFESATAKQVYHSYVRAEGMDGYWVLYSASELEGALRETGSMVALMLDGKALPGNEGQFKMVVAGEKRPARWVRNLKSLTVVKVE